MKTTVNGFIMDCTLSESLVGAFQRTLSLYDNSILALSWLKGGKKLIQKEKAKGKADNTDYKETNSYSFM